MKTWNNLKWWLGIRIFRLGFWVSKKGLKLSSNPLKLKARELEVQRAVEALLPPDKGGGLVRDPKWKRRR
jgi:hypothetical protein